MSNNLELIGNLRINGQSVKSVGQFKSYVGYVMQEDYMLPTFTPYEAFKFVTDLRLPDLSEEQKEARVNEIIKNLGLEKCKNTWIGDTRIRGISGG
jgi:ATP-binding cassette subfamily G (WHITE) protein 2